MKNFTLAALLLFCCFANSQNITINLRMENGTLKYTVTGVDPIGGIFIMDSNKNFKIHIEKPADVAPYDIVVRNQEMPAATLLDNTHINADNYEIVIDPTGKIGANPTILTSKFKIIFNQTVGIPFGTRPPLEPAVPRPAEARTIVLPALQPVGTSTAYAPTGIPLIDAISLNSLKQSPESKQLILRILSYYTSNTSVKSEFMTWADARSFYQGNQYLNNYIPDTNGAQGASRLNPVSMASAAASTVGGLDVTTIADGFAKFIVKRTKQELSIAFFDNFKEQLKENDDLQDGFPNTYSALMIIDKEIYNYEAYLQTLRESFEKDLAALPSNFEKIMDNHAAFFDSVPELKRILKSGFYIAQQVQNDEHPGTIIENYPIDVLTGADDNVINAFKTLKLIVTSVKSNSGSGRYWAEKKEIDELFAPDNEVLKIYLGLLEQQAILENIQFTNAGTTYQLSKIIDDSYGLMGDYAKYKSYFSMLNNNTQKLETAITALKKAEAGEKNFEAYYDVFTSFISMMKNIADAEKLPHFPTGLNISEQTAPYFSLAESLSGIAMDVHRRNYASAIINALSVYNTVFSDTATTVYFTTVYTPTAAEIALDNGVAAKKKAAKKKQDEKENIIYFKNDFFRYGSFMAAIVQAQTSDEVAKVIEAFALPTGSARIKRETRFNVALNAYCGLFAGSEVIKGFDKGGPKLNSFGITAPIGITISEGHRIWPWPINRIGKETKYGWSSSFFISLVDLGAVTAYRFTDDEAAEVPSIQLKDIFSPGFFWSLGIPKSPLSINLGCQVGPNLRKIGTESNEYENNTYIRYSISFCVDLPLLNLYSKDRRN